MLPPIPRPSVPQSPIERLRQGRQLPQAQVPGAPIRRAVPSALHGSIAEQVDQGAPQPEGELPPDFKPDIPETQMAAVEARAAQAEEERVESNVLLKALDSYDRNIDKPAVGALSAALSYGPLWFTSQAKDFRENFGNAEGNIFAKLRGAYEETDTPQFVKGGLELLNPLDPVGWIPFGKLAKGAKAGFKGGVSVGEAITERTERFSAGAKDLMERTSSKLSGGGWFTEADRLSEIKAHSEIVQAETIQPKDVKDLLDEITPGVSETRFGLNPLNPLFDPDYIYYNDLQAKIDILTRQIGPGGARQGNELPPETLAQMQELEAQKAAWEARYGWYYRNLHQASQYSPLWWANKAFYGTGKMFRGVVRVVHQPGWLVQSDLQRSGSVYSFREKHANTQSSIFAALFERHTRLGDDVPEQERIVNAFSRPSVLKGTGNAMGRAFGGTPSWEDDALRERAQSSASDTLARSVEDAFKERGMDITFAIDDVVVTGETLSRVASKLGEPELNVLSLQYRLPPEDLLELRRRAAHQSATYSSVEDVADSVSDLYNNPSTIKRPATPADQADAVAQKMAGDPDYMLTRNGVQLNVYTLAKSDNLGNIYGMADDVFGLRIEWDPHGGKRLLGDPNVDLSRLPSKFWDSYYGRTEQNALFQLTNDNMARNLNGVEVWQLRPEKHQMVALLQRYATRKGEAADRVALGEIKHADELIDPNDPDEIMSILNQDQKDYFDHVISQLDQLYKMLENNGVYEDESIDILKAYIPRFAVLKRGTAVEDDAYVLSQASGRLGTRLTFENSRLGSLEANLANGMVYATPDEMMKQFTREALMAMAQQEFERVAKRYMIYDAGTNLAVSQTRLRGFQQLQEAAVDLAREVETREGRTRILNEDGYVEQKLWQVRRMGEQVGQTEGKEARHLRQRWERLKVDTEKDIVRMLDQVLNPAGKRLVYQGPASDAVTRPFKTVDDVKAVRSELERRNKRYDAFTVWVPFEGRYETMRVYDELDVRHVMARLGPPDADYPPIFFTDPAKAKYTSRRGRYKVERVKIDIKDVPLSGINEVGIDHMKKIRDYLEKTNFRNLEVGADDFSPSTVGLNEEATGILAQVRKLVAREHVKIGSNQTKIVDRIKDRLVKAGVVWDQTVADEVLDVIRGTRTEMSNMPDDLSAAILDDLAVMRDAHAYKGPDGQKEAVLGQMREITKWIERAEERRLSEISNAVTSFRDNALSRAKKAIDYGEKQVGFARDDVKAGEVTFNATNAPSLFRHGHQNLDEVVGRHVGEGVSGTYYQRSGARNPSGDIRDARTGGSPRLGDYPDDAFTAYGIDAKRIPGLAASGWKFTKQGRDEILKMAPDRNWLDSVIKGAGVPADLSRFLTLTFDTGTFMIQGIAVLATRPDLFARTVAHSLPTLLDPKWSNRYIARNRDSLMEQAHHGMPIMTARAEATALLGDDSASHGIGGEVQRRPVLSTTGQAIRDELTGGATGRVQLGVGADTRGGRTAQSQAVRASMIGVSAALGSVTSRAEDLFNTTGIVMRTLMWDSMKDTWARSGGSLHDLSSTLQHMTGFVDMGGAGFSQRHQSIERSLVFFAPRYTRSVMAVVGDAFKGNIPAAQAQKTMAALATVPVLYYWTAATALGQAPKLDPRPISEGGDGAEFMTLDIRGNNIGFGSMWIQLARLISEVGTNDWADAKHFANPNVRYNPFFKFWRNRASPSVNMAETLMRGRTYLGEPLESPGDYAKETAGFVTPFWVDTGLLENGPSMGSLFAGTAELGGLRTFPISTYEKLRVERAKAAEAAYGLDWLEMNDLQKRKLMNDPRYAAVAELTDQLNEEMPLASAGRDGDLGQVMDIYFGVRSAADGRWRNGVRLLEEDFDKGVIDAPGYREALKAMNLERRGANRLLDEDLFAATRDAIKQSFAGGRALPAEDIAFSDYIQEVVGRSDLTDNREYDFRLRAELDRQFRTKWGDQVFQYVNERFRAALETRDFDYPIMIEELYYAREQFSWYWSQTTEEVARQMYNSAHVLQLLERYNNADETLRRELRDGNSDLDQALKIRDGVRQRLRAANRDLDVFLYRWGYADTLLHPDNQYEGARFELRRERMIGPPYPPVLPTGVSP